MDQQTMKAKAAVEAQQQTAPPVTIDMIKNAASIVCEECGSILFQEKLSFKRLSPILSPTGKEQLIPMPLVICEGCGKVPKAFDPQNLAPQELRAVKPETGTPKKAEGEPDCNCECENKK